MPPFYIGETQEILRIQCNMKFFILHMTEIFAKV